MVCVLHPDGPLADLPDAVNITVYRVAQEALSNVMRHAGARSVKLRLSRRADGQLSLVVQDDGVGLPAGGLTPGLGLLGARERVAALAGQLAVDGGPGCGTRLSRSLPAGAGLAAPS